jgi:3-methyl-2-oxobutanoate hydroxymethyltransferase
MLGQFKIFTPKFVKQYADIASVTVEAFKQYIADVKEGAFPTDDHVYHIIEPEEDFERLFKEFD